MNTARERVTQYLSGLMKEEDKAAFEAELERDPELQEEMQLHRETEAMLELEAQAKLKAKVAELDKEGGYSSGNRTVILSIAAASVVLIAVALWFLFPTAQPDALFADYFEPYPDRITALSEDESPLAQGMSLYNQEDFEGALKKLVEVPSENAQEKQAAEFYRAQIYLRQKRFELAVATLENLYEKEGMYQEAANWYLALAYLGAEKLEKAKAQLEAYLDNQAFEYRKTEARQLFDQL